jgi:hypothetical protein
MEGFCIVISIKGLIRPNNGKGDDINSYINVSVITPNIYCLYLSLKDRMKSVNITKLSGTLQHNNMQFYTIP